MNAPTPPQLFTLDDVSRILAEYHDTYRNPRLEPLKVSGFYDLHDHEPTSVAVAFRWSNNDKWPNHDRPGVYLVWDDQMSLRYVGRANPLSRRLSNYFRSSAGAGSPCKIVHPGWRSRPRFVATVPVQKSFEAGALEEYLINKLRPVENATRLDDDC
jgi:hypothetical protein